MTVALATQDPAMALAMTRCLTARSVSGNGRTFAHPRPCGWCPYPIEELRRGVDAFNTWAGYDERSGISARHVVRSFNALPHGERERQIVEAQAFEPEPVRPPEPEAEPGPSSIPPDDEESVWA